MLKNHPLAVFLLSVAGLLVAGCATQSPTPAAAITTPTLAPTNTPKPILTVEPTVTPTLEPTPVPALAPTATPEPIPTVALTAVPTLEPTLAPILAPTDTPEPISAPVSDWAILPGNSAKGELASDFTVTTLAGETFTLSDHRGSPVLLEFISPSCSTCIYEMASFAKIYPAYAGQGLAALFLDVQGFDTPADLQPFIDSLPYPEVHWTIDAEFRVGQLYNVFDTSVTVLIDPAGRIVYQDNGATGPEEFKRLLELALP